MAFFDEDIPLNRNVINPTDKIELLSKFRAPPSGLTSEEFRLCKQFEKNNTCRLGSQCVEAHGVEELNQWITFWNTLKDRINTQLEKNVVCKTFLQKLHLESSNFDRSKCMFVSNLPFVDLKLEESVNVTLSTKPASTSWTISLKSQEKLQNIGLLEDNYRENFFIQSVLTRESNLKHGHLTKSRQEWNSSSCENPFTIIITIKFKSNIYGSFNQAVIFDFGSKSYLSLPLRVEVYPANEGFELSKDGKQLIVSSENRWTEENADIFRLPSTHLEDHCLELQKKYPQAGHKLKFPTAFETTILNHANYKERMHLLLCVEELAQARILASFNLTGNVILTTNYILSPGPLSTAKYCTGENELFAKLELTYNISEDTPAGRLILNNCNVALISFGLDSQGKRRAYECVIEDKTKDAIYLRLNEKLVTDFQLKHGSEFRVQAQFQLNRDVFCEKHWAIDLCTTKILFPDVAVSYRFEGEIPEMVTKLNVQQQQAVAAIYSNPRQKRAPIVIAGPYGTGKTFTFAQCIKVILDQPDTRVLVCTHSNSAADLYVKDYLHPMVQSGMNHYRPLRVFYKVRWLATVHHSVIEYSLRETDPTKACSFRLPKLSEIEQHRIVVTTLGTTSYLLRAGVKKGYFTHILIDEAAQCTECDVLIPLSLADERTRIALAGDHMQLSPEIFSQVAREQQFQVSLLERLYDRYPQEFPCRILLCENYRSHFAIVKFTSELFYDNRLKSVGKNEQHAEFYPLTFRGAKGEDVQDPNSTSIYNMAEIYEIGEVVKKLQDTWPQDSWGAFDENSIGIVSPYSDQVSRIRVHLRHRKLFGVNVERVLNVQGKQFRVIILSTVRTRNTCVNEEKERKRRKCPFLQAGKDEYELEEEEDNEEDEEAQFGFLSSARLMNTAVTRARSLVIVVGDPLALCSVGKCRKLWHRFIEACRDQNSLYGISWMQLRSHLDALEMKKLYGLNPMAPEFVPKVIRVGQSSRATGSTYSPSIIMSTQQYTLGLPPFYLPPPPSSTATAGIPPFPPPPFYQQRFNPCSPHRQPQLNQSPATHPHKPRPRILPFNTKSPNYSTPHLPGPIVPPPVVNHSFGNFGTAPNSTFSQLNSSFQNLHMSPRFSGSAHSQQLHEMNLFRGFDISYSAPLNRDESVEASGPAHRAISKPLTVQQLEAALLKETQMSSKMESWPVSPSNESIWTPLSGPSLWDSAVFSKEEETKNDTVPLYLRTSNSNSQMSDDEMDMLVNSFVKPEEVDSETDGEIPLWADVNLEPNEDIEVKTLQFEESVLRSLRKENLIE
ncbi:probable helicase with zinc finger domain [Daphnia pulicaria]|uniref:probable helicase with zinc finger domain n=1 Tax=Daphnia pulicaria TaxID=35523 RepID=UPI001EEBE2BA|nr:probable helicase with zinc finger domain [Daphnia pulicaria]